MSKGELGLFIDRTYKIVRQDLITRFKINNIDLTPEQWVVVSRLRTDGNMFQTDLANHSFRDKPTVSRIIDILVRKKIVSRTVDEKDGRKYLISLTPLGADLVDRAAPVVDESREQGWVNLSEEEYYILVNVLDKIFINYSKGADPQE